MRASALLALALGTTLSVRASAEAAPEAQVEPEVVSKWSLRVAAEGGIGTRSFELPMDGVVYRTDTGVFSVAGAALEIEHAVSSSVGIGVLARYQSSIGLEITELHTDGSEVPLEVRAHRFEPALRHVPLRRCGTRALALCAGYGVLGLPLVHLVTPAFTLAGPFLRVQLQVPP